VTRRRWDALQTVSCGAKFDVELIGPRSSVSMRWSTLVMVAGVDGDSDGGCVTTVYLGHAIDLHVGLASYSSSLSAKSETKCRRNRIGNFFRNPAPDIYAGEFQVYEERRLRVRSVPRGCRKFLGEKMSEQDPTPPSSHTLIHRYPHPQIRNKL